MWTVASIKIRIFLCRYLECDVLGFGTMWSCRWLTVCFDVGKSTCHNPKDHNLYIHHCENLKAFPIYSPIYDSILCYFVTGCVLYLLLVKQIYIAGYLVCIHDMYEIMSVIYIIDTFFPMNVRSETATSLFSQDFISFHYHLLNQASMSWTSITVNL
jgi:hypothetical protein